MTDNLNKKAENINVENTENAAWDGNDHPGRSGLIMLILCVVGFILVGMVSNSTKESKETAPAPAVSVETDAQNVPAPAENK